MRLARITRTAAAVVAILTALLLTFSTVSADYITTDQELSGQSYNGVTHDFSRLPNFIFVSIVSSTVSGSGLAIAGKDSAETTSTDVGVTYTFTGGSITAPVRFTSSILPNSAFTFSGSSLNMASVSSAFVFSVGNFVSNSTFTFARLTATWPSGSGTTGSLVNVEWSFAVTSKSAVFIEGCTVSNAKSVLSITSTSSNVASVTEGSVLAIDQVNCVNCNTAVAVLTIPLTVSGSSMLRVFQCDAGSRPLVSSNRAVTISGRSLYTVTDSKSTGALFSHTGAQSFTVSESSVVTFRALTGASTGISANSPIPTSIATGSSSYGDSACRFGGVAMGSQSAFLSNGLRVTQYIAGTACSMAECIPGTSSSVTGSTRSTCSCGCAQRTYQAYCTYMMDPLYTALTGGYICNLFKCVECAPGSIGICRTCEYGYELDGAGQCIRSCAIPNCAQCDTNGCCTKCNPGYTLSGYGQCVANGSGCPPGYRMASNGRCEPDCSISGCLQCSSPSTCAKCEPHLVLSGDCRRCMCRSNCHSCTSCCCRTCMAGYKLKKGNLCVRIMNGASPSVGAVTAALVGLMTLIAMLS